MGAAPDPLEAIEQSLNEQSAAHTGRAVGAYFAGLRETAPDIDIENAVGLTAAFAFHLYAVTWPLPDVVEVGYTWDGDDDE